MPTVALTPLASDVDFNNSAFANMAVDLPDDELKRIMLVATRQCEGVCKTRLAPFAGLTETIRLQDGDVEDVIPSGMPLPMQAQMGLDYSRALGIPTMVRHFWVRNYPRQYEDMWTGAITSFQVSWALQSAPFVVPTSAIAFEQDTGHGRFNVGTFVPPGTTGIVTYSGGFSQTPEDLAQASMTMAAAVISRMLNPIDGPHDELRADAIEQLVPFGARTPKSRA